jgi:regulatory protein
MEPRRHSKIAKPLDAAALRQLALDYVGRYATSSGKLRQYLGRKLFERGWSGDEAAPVAAIIEDMIERRFIDDIAFAEQKAGQMLRRGYGAGRVRAALQTAGIEGDVQSRVLAIGDEEAVTAAIAFARRRRIGPFQRAPVGRPERARAIASLIRAGHAFDLASQIVDMPPENNDR